MRGKRKERLAKNKTYLYKYLSFFSVIFLIAALVFSWKYLLHENQNYNINSSGKSGGKSVDIPDISKTPTNQIAMRDRLLTMLDKNNADSVFKIVDTIQADPALSLNCHEIAHDIGHEAYERYGFVGAMNFTDTARLNHASVQDMCAGGYIHGILEEAALHNPDFKNNPGPMCADVPDSIKASCYHGIGHALMFSYERETFPSLETCRKVGSQTAITRCFEGVWMELFWGNTEYSGPDTLGWNTSRPLQTCIDTKSDAKPACFLYSAFGYLRIHKKDYVGAVNLCTNSNLNDSDSGFCLKGVGITMNSRFKGHNLEQSEIYVDGLDTNKKKSFYQGVFGYANLSGVTAEELKNTCAKFKNDKDICESVMLPL